MADQTDTSAPEGQNTIVVTADSARVQYESRIRPIIRPIMDAPDAFEERIQNGGTDEIYALVLSLGLSVRADYKLLLKTALNDDDKLIRQFETLFDRIYQEDGDYALKPTVQHFLPLYAVIREFYAQNMGKEMPGEEHVIKTPNPLFDLQYDVESTDDADAATQAAKKPKLQSAHEALGDVMKQYADQPGTFFSYLEHAMDAVRAILVKSLDIPLEAILSAGTSGNKRLIMLIAATMHTMCNPEMHGNMVMLQVACDLNKVISELGVDVWYSRECDASVVKLVAVINELIIYTVGYACRFNGMVPAIKALFHYMQSRNVRQCIEDCETLTRNIKVKEDNEGDTLRAIFQKMAAVSSSITNDDRIQPHEKISYDACWCMSAHLHYVRATMFVQSDAKRQNEQAIDYVARIGTLMTKCAAFVHMASGTARVKDAVRRAISERGVQFWIKMLGGSVDSLVQYATLLFGAADVKQLPNNFEELFVLFVTGGTDGPRKEALAESRAQLMALLDSGFDARSVEMMAAKNKRSADDSANQIYRQLERLRQVLPGVEDPMLDLYCGMYVLYNARLSAMQCVDENMAEWKEVCSSMADETNPARIPYARLFRPHAPGCFIPKCRDISPRVVKILYAFLGTNSVAINNLVMDKKAWQVELLSLGFFHNSNISATFPEEAQKAVNACKAVTSDALEMKGYKATYFQTLVLEWMAPLVFSHEHCSKLLQFNKKDKMTNMLWSRYMPLFASKNKNQIAELATSPMSIYKSYTDLPPVEAPKSEAEASSDDANAQQDEDSVVPDVIV